MKNGYNEEIKIEDYEVQVLKKTLHDLVVRIGYNVDDNLFHLLEDSSWPFWFNILYYLFIYLFIF